MSLEKTHQLLEWLESTFPYQNFNHADLKELLSIAMYEIEDEYNKTFDHLPRSVYDSFIQAQKESGEFYKLDNKIKHFKEQFLNKLQECSEH